MTAKYISSLEQFSRIVSPSGWKDAFLAMLTACFDGAGKDTTEYNIVTVAGFASFSGVWEEFTIRWNERLRDDGIPYFHAGDFAHSRGVFEDGWKRNEKRRRSLLADLMVIIKDCGLRKFGCILRLEDYRFAIKKKSPQVDPNWPLMDAFAIAAMRSTDDFHAYARGEGVRKNVECIFEKGDPEDTLRYCFRGNGYSDPFFTWSKPHTDAKGFLHEPFVGLQAAGWAAYEYYLDGERLMFSEPTNRWAFEQFESLPGHVILMGRSHLSKDIASLNDHLGKQMEAVRESVLRLEQIKAAKVMMEKR